MKHEPCTSRGDCYHARGGSIGGRNGPHEAKVRAGRKMQETWGKTSEAHEQRVRAGYIGGRTQGAIQGPKNVKSGLLAKAREICDKKTNTKPELAVKAKLDELGICYEHPYNLNNRFLCDFYLPDFNTIIEVDGCYWHGCQDCGYLGKSERLRTDPGRNAYIRACGYRLEIVKEHELE